MSDVNLQTALDRILAATPDSPIAVFRGSTRGLLNTMFANTVTAQLYLKTRRRLLVGVFHKDLDRDAVRAKLEASLK